jgi:hypothetical protein
LIRRIATFGLGISPRPRKRGDGSSHYLPLSSEARADQGCRKRRNQVPDWSEITCRFPPKSPAAFDRNRVPVCSDFCSHRSGGGITRRYIHKLDRALIEAADLVAGRIKGWIDG